MDLALLAVGLFAVVGLVLVLWPPRRVGEVAVAFFMWSWLAGELPVHHALLVVSLAAVAIAEGALGSPLGAIGLALVLVGLAGPVLAWRDVARVRARAEAVVGEPLRPRVSLLRYALFAWFGDRAIARTVIREGRVLCDVYRRRAPADAGPITARPPGERVFVYIHGGGWVLGFRRWQGRPLIRRLVLDGWTAVSVEYRRAPRVRWPGPIDDVREALAWVRRALPGVDRARLVVSGNSAGGHLAALATLTDRGTPPIAACVPWYGVFDLTDARGHWPHRALRRLWGWLIMRASLERAPERWWDASPVAHLRPDAPPFLVVHGSHDSLVPVAVARDFAARAPRATYLEVEGAQHAFDVFWSRRGAVAIEAVARWLDRTVHPAPLRGASRDLAPAAG